MATTLFGEEPIASGIVPREYQAEDVANSFRLWDSGVVGTLTRCFTGGGKTIMTCLKFQKWLERGPNYRCMVLSYEQELVNQFAQEIEDVLGITPGIEMGSEEIKPGSIPQIVVASRQSLMTHELATEEQRDELRTWGLCEIGLLTKSAAKRAISALRQGVDLQAVAEAVDEHNAGYRCNHQLGRVSRLYKFDWRDNWLLAMDEAHKYSMKLKTVGHIVEWFEQNSNHRRSGVTATPKRRDNVSTGTKLFPGISLDFPFTKAVAEGYAVPYTQKFIQVEGIDFKRIKELCGTDQKKWDSEIERMLNTEEALAKLCEPMLDMVGDRKTLIFSPSKDMAQNVADYINARSEIECPSCGTRKWYPNLLLGDGAKCKECGDFLSTSNAIKSGIQAYSINGDVPPKSRQEVYRGHKGGKFQFLSICGLCREGYNDPDISCVAIFRPVSRAASSLAEQMKGRGSRPRRGCITGLNTTEERLAAIAASGKSDCLIIDPVGVTGLADCASTIQIYAEGLPDAIVARAEEIALTGGVDDPQAAIEQAKREDEEEKERQRIEREQAAQRRREEAERRAKLDAEVTYSAHDIGTAARFDGPRNASMATEGQLKFLHMLGIDFQGWEPSKKQAGRMISQLNEHGMDIESVVYQNGIEKDHWKRARPSVPQLKLLARNGITATDMTPREASQAIDAIKKGRKPPAAFGPLTKVAIASIGRATEQTALDHIAREVFSAHKQGVISDAEYSEIVAKGKEARRRIERERF